MQSLLTAAALAGAIAIVVAPASAAEITYGDLPPFTAVDISSGIDAVVTVGSAQTVRAESPHQQQLDELIVEVRDGRLSAKTDWNLLDLFFFEGRQIRLHVTVPDLERAEASSGADVEVTGLAADAVTLRASSGADLHAVSVAGKRFDIEASSGADLNVEGSCETAEIGASSGSTVEAEGLTCAEVEVDVSSGADATVFASASVTAEASSGGNIRIHGNPTQHEEDASSGGDIEFAN